MKEKDKCWKFLTMMTFIERNLCRDNIHVQHFCNRWSRNASRSQVIENFNNWSDQGDQVIEYSLIYSRLQRSVRFSNFEKKNLTN